MSTSHSAFSLFPQLWPFIRQYKSVVLGASVALVITASINLALGQSLKHLIDEGIGAGSIERLNQSLLMLMLLIVIMAAGSFARFYWVTWLGERVAADLRQAVFSHLLNLQPAFFEENQSGEIMSRLTTDTTLLQTIIGSSLSFALRNSLTVTGGLVMLLVTNLKLSLVVLLGVPLVLLPVRWMGKRLRKLSRESQDTVADVGSYAGEVLRQIKTVQSYGREDFERVAFRTEVEQAFETAKQRIFQRSALTASVILMAFTVITIMLWIGGHDVMTGAMTAGELAAFIFYAGMVAFGVAGVAEVYGELQRASGASDRLMELLSEVAVINDPETPLSVKDNYSEYLGFNQVSFAYPSRSEYNATKSLSFSIKKGQTLALVGPSGAGKSTLFELILRFYDPDSGSIKLQGTDLKDLSRLDLRQRIALVPQQPVLFSGDVWRNIRYGRPNASDEEVRDAAQKAHALDFIQALPFGFASELGEGGVRLSGGQKQRIVIARAILNNPELLLLDEATSALDTQSEKVVQEALTELMQERTTVIIAHRLSTVRDADTIVVLDKGEVVEQGTHEQLMKKSLLYKKLAEIQFVDENGDQ